MPQKTVMGPNGTVVLPEALHGFFYQGEAIEVAQYRLHLGLWREWQRVKQSLPSGGGEKVTGKHAFSSAATRFWERGRQVFDAGDAETGLYLTGMALECRLKVLVPRQP